MAEVRPLFGAQASPTDPAGIVFACPACGRPRSVALVGPLSRCESCGSEALPSRDVRAAIQTARLAALNLPFRAEQVRATNDIERAFEAASEHVRRRWPTLAVVLALPAVVATFALLAHQADNDARPIIALDAAFTMHILFGFVGRWRRAWMRRRLAAALDARAVRVAFLDCRVCGAPLATSDLEHTVITCAHCDRENVLDPATATEHARREVDAFAKLDQRVQARVARWLIAEAVLSRLELYAPLIVCVVLVVHLVRG